MFGAISTGCHKLSNKNTKMFKIIKIDKCRNFTVLHYPSLYSMFVPESLMYRLTSDIPGSK